MINVVPAAFPVTERRGHVGPRDTHFDASILLGSQSPHDFQSRGGIGRNSGGVTLFQPHSSSRRDAATWVPETRIILLAISVRYCSAWAYSR